MLCPTNSTLYTCVACSLCWTSMCTRMSHKTAHSTHVLLVLCAETTHAHQHTCRFSTGYSLCCFDSRARNTHVRITHTSGSTCVPRVEFWDIRLTCVHVWFQHILYWSTGTILTAVDFNILADMLSCPFALLVSSASNNSKTSSSVQGVQGDSLFIPVFQPQLYRTDWRYRWVETT